MKHRQIATFRNMTIAKIGTAMLSTIGYIILFLNLRHLFHICFYACNYAFTKVFLYSLFVVEHSSNRSRRLVAGQGSAKAPTAVRIRSRPLI